MAIVDKPAIQYIIEECVESGIEEILIISGRNKEMIANHFDRTPELDNALRASGRDDLLRMSQRISSLADIYYVRQKETLGLGHAVSCAKAFVGNEPFAVLLSDDLIYHPDQPCLKQLIDVHDQHGCSVLGVQQVDEAQVSKYGIIAGHQVDERTYVVTDMVEKPERHEAPSNMAILGRYILQPDVFEALASLAPGKNNEIQLTDGIKKLLDAQKCMAYAFQGIRYDVGDKVGYLKATVEYALRHDELNVGFRDYLKGMLDKL